MIAENRFVCTDCFSPKGFASVPDHSIRMVLADLPYGQTSNAWDTPINLPMFWREVHRVLVPDGTAVLFAKGKFFIQLVNSNLDEYRYEWVWNKNNGANFAHVRHHPLHVHEFVVIFYTKVGVYNPQMVAGEAYKQKRSADQCKGIADSMAREYLSESDGWRFPKSVITMTNMSQRFKVHPTQKPVKLFTYLINTYSHKDEWILDPCAGSGTTAVAALQTGRHYICFEQEVEYCQKASQRLSQWQTEHPHSGLDAFM